MCSVNGALDTSANGICWDLETLWPLAESSQRWVSIAKGLQVSRSHGFFNYCYLCDCKAVTALFLPCSCVPVASEIIFYWLLSKVWKKKLTTWFCTLFHTAVSQHPRAWLYGRFVFKQTVVIASFGISATESKISLSLNIWFAFYCGCDSSTCTPCTT